MMNEVSLVVTIGNCHVYIGGLFYFFLFLNALLYTICTAGVRERYCTIIYTYYGVSHLYTVRFTFTVHICLSVGSELHFILFLCVLLYVTCTAGVRERYCTIIYTYHGVFHLYTVRFTFTVYI